MQLVRVHRSTSQLDTKSGRWTYLQALKKDLNR